MAKKEGYFTMVFRPIEEVELFKKLERKIFSSYGYNKINIEIESFADKHVLDFKLDISDIRGRKAKRCFNITGEDVVDNVHVISFVKEFLKAFEDLSIENKGVENE